MTDDILAYLDRELKLLRERRQSFAERHPALADQLTLSGDTIDDPQIARLIDAFAFLTARIQRKLDEELPELTDALMAVLHPHLLAPIPSMSILQLEPRHDLSAVATIAAKHSIEIADPAGDICRFRTAYPVELWPIRVRQAMLGRRPLPAPENRYARNAAGILKLTLEITNQSLSFGQIEIDRLRFHLPGEPRAARALYQQIFARTISVALADHPGDKAPAFLDRRHLGEVGFEPDEAMLPDGPTTGSAYLLLTEYFAFPNKFLFFDLTGLSAKTLGSSARSMDIYFYLSHVDEDLEPLVSAESFALGCTPIINLFRQRAEPFTLPKYLHEVRVVPDLRRQHNTEIYAIDRVTASGVDGSNVAIDPLYLPNHDGRRTERWYWHAQRRLSDTTRRSEMFLALVDLGLESWRDDGWTISIETTCFNPEAQRQIATGGRNSTITLVDAGADQHRLRLLCTPTRVFRPNLGQGGRWKLLSSLSLNHLALTQDAGRLREILRLYDLPDSAETHQRIDSIVDLAIKPSTARLPDAPAGICRGIDVTLELADAAAATGDGYLLAAVLDRFFRLTVTLNSFVRLGARFRGQTDVLRQWPAHAGSRPLI